MTDLYVYSTLTNDTLYGPWCDGGADLPNKPKQVLIYGGANRADKDNRLWTPRGVATRITQAEYEVCKADAVFVAHVEEGFLFVSEHDDDPDHVATDMTGRSPDAPITPGDIENENETKPEDKKLNVETNVPPAPARKRQTAPRKRGVRNPK